MTSKKDLYTLLGSERRRKHELSDRNFDITGQKYRLELQLDSYKRENTTLAREIQSYADSNRAIVQFVDDLFVIEPQLKHTLTDGIWDFERVHRAAEALRADDALASLGYTDQCVEWPDNVIPLFPHDPEGAAA